MKLSNLVLFSTFIIALSGCCPDRFIYKKDYIKHTIIKPDDLKGVYTYDSWLDIRNNYKILLNEKRYKYPFQGAYTNAKGNKIIEIYAGFNMGNATIVILSDSDNIDIKPKSFNFKMSNKEFTFNRVSIDKYRNPRTQHAFYRHTINYLSGIPYSKLQKHHRSGKGVASANLPFTIDGEAYSFNFVATLNYETVPGRCSFGP